jgi:hypothetical protein
MRWYRQALGKILNKEVDWDSDDLRISLHSSAYTPDLDAHDYVNDLTNELATGGGYTSGGLAVASESITTTLANAWGVARANSTAYSVDDVFRPAAGNGHLYRVVTAGTSAGAPPVFPTNLGETVADGTALIQNAGRAVTVLGFTDPVWAAATFGPARYAVLSDRTPGAAASQPLLGLLDFGVDKTGGGGNFTIAMHAALRALHVLIP